jgi:predicted transcriptional regulator with HTH domain
MREYKEGEYITYEVRYPGSEPMVASGTVVRMVNENGKKQYLVSEGNGGQNMTYVNPKDIKTLLYG